MSGRFNRRPNATETVVSSTRKYLDKYGHKGLENLIEEYKSEPQFIYLSPKYLAIAIILYESANEEKEFPINMAKTLVERIYPKEKDKLNSPDVYSTMYRYYDYVRIKNQPFNEDDNENGH